MEEVFRVGEVKRISYEIRGDDAAAFIVTSGTITIYDPDGAAIVSAAALTLDSGSAAVSHTVWYTWTPTLAGDYTYVLKYVISTQTIAEWDSVVVLSPVSMYDRWVARIRRWLLDAGAGQDFALLSFADYRDAAQAAIRQYERHKPQRRQVIRGLTTGLFEYSLPADWSKEFSVIEFLEYPRDDDEQSVLHLRPSGWRVDEIRGRWRFVSTSPTTGESARLTYTARHVLSDDEDTVDPGDFDSVTQYAAGLALGTLANKRAGSGSGAAITTQDVLATRTAQQEYSSQSAMMLKTASAGWSAPTIGNPYCEWEYLRDHNRLVNW